MKSDKTLKDIIVVGFALFAMFFGSGNLIFPAYLGRLVGQDYWTGLIGFMLMGVGLPLLGVMATAKAGGDFEVIAQRVGSVFSFILITALILTIGPLFAIPRTAATTYEIGIAPFFSTTKPLVIMSIYFGINLIFVWTSASVVDVIGKCLTPVLLLSLLVLIIKGVANPVGPLVASQMDHVFANALIEGYQTMDALAAVCFGGIVVQAIRKKGYKDTGNLIKLTFKASLVAIIGLGIIYGGLMYLGSHTGHIEGTIEKTSLIVALAHEILGQTGAIFLAIAVSLACMTTSIGLTVTGATYFSKHSKGRVSYKVAAVIISFVSMSIALMGVDKIIGLTLPVLKLLYPVIIVLVVLGLFDKWIIHQKVYAYVVYVTLFVAMGDVLSASINSRLLQRVMGSIPFSNLGFAWVVPALIVFCGLNVKHYIKQYGIMKTLKNGL